MQDKRIIKLYSDTPICIKIHIGVLFFMTISIYNVIIDTNKKYSYVEIVYIPIWVYKINVSLDTINRV